jgi:hypothetical protein
LLAHSGDALQQASCQPRPITAAHIDALAVGAAAVVPAPMARKYAESQPGEIFADKRMRAFALGAVKGYAKRLPAMSPREGSGRNMALFHAACALGKFVHHKVLSLSEVQAGLMPACKANALMQAGERCAMNAVARLRAASYGPRGR